MNKFLILIVVLFLNSCTYNFRDGIDFKIQNKTQQTISEIKFYTSEKKDIFEGNYLEPNKKIENFLSMKNCKVDGSYIIEFKNEKGIIKKQNFGYYTNGSPLENCIYIEIKNDTIITKLEK